MAVTRRQFLKGFGVVSVLVAGGGVYRAVDQGVFSAGQGPAYAAWQDWRTEAAEGPLRLVQSAILAANPHNSQPWLFRVTADQIEVFADLSRTLRTMDVYKREMYIGLGCALENMLLTATAVGYTSQLIVEQGQLTRFSESSAVERVAVLKLTPGAVQTSPLYAAIPARHTNRYNYDTTRSLPQSLLAELAAFAEPQSNVQLHMYHKHTPQFTQILNATLAATAAIIADHEMAYDSYVWFDQSWEEVHREKDGIYIDTSGSSAPIRAFVKLLPSVSQSQIDSSWTAGTQTVLQNSDVLGLITVPDLYAKAGALHAGRVWQRMHLWATVNGIAMQPMNQIPEVIDRDRDLRRDSTLAALIKNIIGDPAQQPTFLFRMGYPLNPVLPSARRPVGEVLL